VRFCISYYRRSTDLDGEPPNQNRIQFLTTSDYTPTARPPRREVERHTATMRRIQQLLDELPMESSADNYASVPAVRPVLAPVRLPITLRP